MQSFWVQVSFVGDTYGFFEQVYFFPPEVALIPDFEQATPFLAAAALAGVAIATVDVRNNTATDAVRTLRNINTSVGMSLV